MGGGKEAVDVVSEESRGKALYVGCGSGYKHQRDK